MSLATAVRNVKAAAARDLVNRIAADLRDDVTRLRDRVTSLECAARMSGDELHHLASMQAYVRCGLDSIVHAADLGGAVTLTAKDMAEAEEANQR